MNHYFLSPVLVYDGVDLKVAMTRALVSPSGVYHVFQESEEIHRAFLAGKKYKVRLDGTDYRARLVRESGPAGVHYNLHLLLPGRDEHLEGMLDRFGFASPWKRDYARIPASSVFRQVEAPVAAILHRFSGRASADVRNFSYHGIFLQLDCANPSLGETVGQKVQFELVTSKGRKLELAQARIARIYDEITAPGKVQPEGFRRAYHQMILESCREIGKEREEE
jgi:hypothetical protein